MTKETKKKDAKVDKKAERKVKKEKPVKKEVKKVEKKGAEKERVKKAGKKEDKVTETQKEGKKAESRKERKNYVFTIGKRKRAVARTVIRPGSGLVLINGQPLDNIENEVIRLRIKEPFILSEYDWSKYNFSVNIKGGGIMGQTDAVRMSIARGMVEILGSSLKQKFLEYDRNLLVYDPRRTEPHKPPRSSQGPRRYKQRSKR